MGKRVMWAILAKQAEKTLPLYLKCLLNQDYDKKDIVLYIRTNDSTDKTENILEKFILQHGDEFSSVVYDKSSIDARLGEFENHDWNPFRFQILGKIRNESLKAAQENACDFYFVCDVDNFLVSNCLSNLVSLNLEIVAPMLVNARSHESKIAGVGGSDRYSNFHCDYDEQGAYLHDPAYDKIITREYRGIHKVRLVHCTYLVRADVIPSINYLHNPFNYEFRNFAITAEQNGIPQYLDNRIPYGSLSLLDDPAESELLIQDFERLAALDGCVYKILHLKDNENHFGILEQFFGRYVSRLTAITHPSHSLEEARKYLTESRDLKLSSNVEYSGWMLEEIRIWASWKNALIGFLNTSSKALILVEDDFSVAEDFVSKSIPIALSELPANWDYLSLYTPDPQRSQFAAHHEIEKKTICLPYQTSSNGAVVFSRSGALKTLKYISGGICQTTQQYLFDSLDSLLSGYALKPAIMADKIIMQTNWETKEALTKVGKRFSIANLMAIEG